jgi:hypothetical protein
MRAFFLVSASSPSIPRRRTSLRKAR